MYQDMFQYVEDYLDEITGKFVFRKRIDHIRRVFMWVNRLIEEDYVINKEALLIATIFHDVGYKIPKDHHAENGATICEAYLKDHRYEPELIQFVTYLIKNHSNKELLYDKDTPLELILLMEADLLDETGALSIVWDCMTEGGLEKQNFMKTYEHIVGYTGKQLEENPMVTRKAINFWESKQKLIKEFIKQLAFDLETTA